MKIDRMTSTDLMALAPSSIESECRRLGHALGWRFLTCPEGNIETASVALVTINPAGDRFETAAWSVEDGSAYVVESWKGCPRGEENLQWQVRRMFEVIGIDPHRVLSGYLVPFRSPNWERLPLKEQSLDFGIGLWKQVFERASIRMVVAFGKETAPHIGRLLNTRLVSKHATDWGNQTVDVYRFGADGRLIVLPHLSRFRLFGRPASEAAFLAAIGRAGEAPISEGGQASRRPTGRATPALGGIIRILVEVNPKRGKSRLRFDCYRDGMVIGDYEETVRQRLGAAEASKCRADIAWDADPKRALILIERG